MGKVCNHHAVQGCCDECGREEAAPKRATRAAPASGLLVHIREAMDHFNDLANDPETSVKFDRARDVAAHCAHILEEAIRETPEFHPSLLTKRYAVYHSAGANAWGGRQELSAEYCPAGLETMAQFLAEHPDIVHLEYRDAKGVEVGITAVEEVAS